jgi:hypothetical protein
LRIENYLFFRSKKSFAPRFKETIIEPPGDVMKIERKLYKMQENKLQEINKNLYKLREFDRKRHQALIKKEEKEEMDYMKREEDILNKLEKENMKRINKGLKPIEGGVINYAQVEESAPLVFIKFNCISIL